MKDRLDGGQGQKPYNHITSKLTEEERTVANCSGVHGFLGSRKIPKLPVKFEGDKPYSIVVTTPCPFASEIIHNNDGTITYLDRSDTPISFLLNHLNNPVCEFPCKHRDDRKLAKFRNFRIEI